MAARARRTRKVKNQHCKPTLLNLEEGEVATGPPWVGLREAQSHMRRTHRCELFGEGVVRPHGSPAPGVARPRGSPPQGSPPLRLPAPKAARP